jgi:hypothetical protein
MGRKATRGAGTARKKSGFGVFVSVEELRGEKSTKSPRYLSMSVERETMELGSGLSPFTDTDTQL